MSSRATWGSGPACPASGDSCILLLPSPPHPWNVIFTQAAGPEGWVGEALARTEGGGLTKLVNGSAEAGSVSGCRKPLGLTCPFGFFSKLQKKMG